MPKPLFYDAAFETAEKRMIQYPNSHVQITKSAGSYNIVAQGAGCMVLDYFTEEILT